MADRASGGKARNRCIMLQKVRPEYVRYGVPDLLCLAEDDFSERTRDLRRRMRGPPHLEVAAYGCWLSPLTRFAGPHCGDLSSEAAGTQLAHLFVRVGGQIVKGGAGDPGDAPLWQDATKMGLFP